MKFFKHCTTIEQVKALYKQLAKENHPDLGGDTVTMQQINTEYAFATAVILKGGQLSNEEINEELRVSEALREAIESIIDIVGIEIEIVGNWLWVSGNTKPHCSRERGGTGRLTDAKFKFHKKRCVWFFHTEEFKARGGNKSMEEIRAKYGSQTVNSYSKKVLR